MRLFLAVRAFFAVLFSRQVAAGVQKVLAGGPDAGTPTPPTQADAKPSKPVMPPKPVRSEALTLLETLQREARFVDIVKEPLAQYSDEQIGAAAREVLRDCGKVLDRLFGLQPIVEGEEGSPVRLPDDSGVGRFRLSGNSSGEAKQGRLVHHGWEAQRCELPLWSGAADSARVIAPAEVEVS
jgi:hypothetical protein